MVKQFFNRLICLCRGHEWEHYKTKREWVLCDRLRLGFVEYYKCTRCGKTKEEVV